ncbi:Eukaryotic translation initiation factor 3 subunit H, variant 2 [Schistosoma haematobium]|uniref:Eukaryotic translation initiation factor 3 subunit H, variant 2 n=1 Tax=Schistosoma haematobium TaxID=6185 RepID=A0A922LY86_SCHHA|nr:Eukaryotic translation initiation factor 3 subunit H, variant 2 [Schistosoma haematobium]KAH9595807.1 Eukaryotic translation initiation factor 3 subunit H, variant 2 [Schistosoma haematobium]
MEQEVEGESHFLDIRIRRTSDGTLHRHIHRKNTRSGVYLNCYSFCPMSYKKGIVRTLFDRARKICSNECLDDKIALITNCLRGNAYPVKFIYKYSKTNPRAKYDRVGKKTCFLYLRFKGDEIAGLINHRLNSELKVAYPAAKLTTVWETNCSLKQTKIDKSSFLSSSNCIYQSTYTCQSTYIRRTERRVHVRISEHVPKNLRLPGTKALNSAIARHLLDTGHTIDIPHAFKIINRQRSTTTLRFAETIVIKTQAGFIYSIRDINKLIITLVVQFFCYLGYFIHLFILKYLFCVIFLPHYLILKPTFHSHISAN